MSAKQPTILSDRTYGDDRWRHSTYERPDGSKFHVSIPPWHPSGEHFPIVYDESAETEMFLRLSPLSCRDCDDTGETRSPAVTTDSEGDPIPCPTCDDPAMWAAAPTQEGK